MITPELISYIKGELAKGRSREDVHADLVKAGGWGEADLSEAFKSVLPMQGAIQSSGAEQVSVSPKISSKLLKIILGVVVLAGIGFALWFYRVPLIGFWNSGIEKITELYSSYFGTKTSTDITNTAPQNNSVVVTPIIKPIKDCGITDSPDPKNKSTYENNAVLNCFGNSALFCEDAKAILKDDLFPTVFQIIKNKDGDQNICNFRLSYGADSTLIDLTGKKLALQYISCPISIVKAVDETKTPPVFNNPSVENLGKYASQIYFYGTLGLFIENNINQKKIEEMGCAGDYISTMLSSYRRTQSKN